MKKESEKRPSQRSNSANEPEVHFTEADLQAIAQELGVSCTPGLKYQLNTSAESYFSNKDFWANKEDTAEGRGQAFWLSFSAKVFWQPTS
jgi:hypothetical protein